MELRSLLAYALIAILVLGVALGWRRFTREARGDRRAYRQSERARQRRRDERIRSEREA
jgi:type II secretory pathway pseudopilin PulG